MIDLVVVLHRAPGTSRDAFRHAWEEEASEPSFAPEARRLAIHLPLETDALRAHALGQTPRPAPCDGLAFATVDDVYAADTIVLGPRAETGRAEIHRVEEVLHWDRCPGRAPGRTSPGVVMTAFVRRRPDLSLAEFRARYLEHAPVARAHHPGVARYVQSFVVSPASEEAPDAIAQLHFASEDDLTRRFYRDETSPRAVADDVARFLVPRGGGSLLAVERVLR